MSSRAGRGRHLGGQLGLDRVGHGLVPGDEPGPAAGAVLGLEDDVDRGQGRVGRAVGDDDDLGGPGEGGGDPDPPLPRDLALGLGHVDVAGPDDDVDGGDRLRAVGQGGDGLGPADAVDLGDAGDGGGGQGEGRDLAVGPGRDAEGHLGHARHQGRDGGHQHGRGVEGPAPGHVAPGPVDRLGPAGDGDAVARVAAGRRGPGGGGSPRCPRRRPRGRPAPRASAASRAAAIAAGGTRVSATSTPSKRAGELPHRGIAPVPHLVEHGRAPPPGGRRRRGRPAAGGHPGRRGRRHAGPVG